MRKIFSDFLIEDSYYYARETCSDILSMKLEVSDVTHDVFRKVFREGLWFEDCVPQMLGLAVRQGWSPHLVY